LREKIGSEWKQYTVIGKPVEGKKTYQVYFYSIGAGTIWLDDVALVPVGGKVDDSAVAGGGWPGYLTPGPARNVRGARSDLLGPLSSVK